MGVIYGVWVVLFVSEFVCACVFPSCHNRYLLRLQKIYFDGIVVKPKLSNIYAFVKEQHFH